MTPGMVFTIEPILVEGASRISVWEDGWTAATFDGGRCVGTKYASCSKLHSRSKLNLLNYGLTVLF